MRTSRAPDQRLLRAITLGDAALLAGLLVLPTCAALRVDAGLERGALAAGAAIASLFAWCLYWTDKRAAENGRWRIPEMTLHACALCGGWPGAYLAQRWFRHKTSKLSFQACFWLIVALHEALALDALLSWRLTHEAVDFVRAQLG